MEKADRRQIDSIETTNIPTKKQETDNLQIFKGNLRTHEIDNETGSMYVREKEIGVSA